MVLHRRDLKPTLVSILSYMMSAAAAPSVPATA
jgi:hypothetical protein